MGTSEHFALHEVAPGVHAAVARPGGTSVSNAAIIDLGDKTLVVDTMMTLAAAEDLHAAGMELTGRSAAIAVNSHWHSDHTGGNQIFPRAEILATPRTVELIAENSPEDRDAYAAEIDEFMAWARKLRDEAEGEDEVARADARLHLTETLLAEVPRFRLTLPSPRLGELLEIVGTARTADVISFGAGHTESDAFVHLPDDGVIVTGDLLWVDSHPRINDGEPAAWATSLDRMAALGAMNMIPGHGPIGDPHHLAAMAAYMREVDAVLTEVAGDPDADPSQLPVPAGSGTWDAVDRFHGSIQALLDRHR
jgi:glyoxylase-like metal-dependent hydrolase (beta-lactamase superfamily II)